MVDKKILLIVDVQQGNINAGSRRSKKVANEIVKLSKCGIFDYIYAVRFHNTNPCFSKILKYNRFKTEQEIALIKDLTYNEIVDKNSYSCVNKEFIDKLIKLNGGKKPTKIYICGFDTDACVYSTALSILIENIRPIVFLNYCYSSGGFLYHLVGRKMLIRNIGRFNTLYLDLRKVLKDKDKERFNYIHHNS